MMAGGGGGAPPSAPSPAPAALWPDEPAPDCPGPHPSKGGWRRDWNDEFAGLRAAWDAAGGDYANLTKAGRAVWDAARRRYGCGQVLCQCKARDLQAVGFRPTVSTATAAAGGDQPPSPHTTATLPTLEQRVFIADYIRQEDFDVVTLVSRTPMAARGRPCSPTRRTRAPTTARARQRPWLTRQTAAAAAAAAAAVAVAAAQQLQLRPLPSRLCAKKTSSP